MHAKIRRAGTSRTLVVSAFLPRVFVLDKNLIASGKIPQSTNRNRPIILNRFRIGDPLLFPIRQHPNLKALNAVVEIVHSVSGFLFRKTKHRLFKPDSEAIPQGIIAIASARKKSRINTKETWTYPAFATNRRFG